MASTSDRTRRKKEQLILAKQGFGAYLKNDFFAQPSAVYAIWEENGEYISALRLEPYQDGLLIEALETIPGQRRKGYAVKLIQVVQSWLATRNAGKLYAHVSKKKTASLRTHDRRGFQIILDHAVYTDHTVNEKHYTLCYEK